MTGFYIINSVCKNDFQNCFVSLHLKSLENFLRIIFLLSCFRFLELSSKNYFSQNKSPMIFYFANANRNI